MGGARIVKEQVYWALVNDRGYISPGHMSYARKNVIASVIFQYAGMRPRLCPGASDTQFWRKLKRKYDWTVRRVGLRALP